MTSSNPYRDLRIGVLFAAMAQVLWPATAAAQNLPGGLGTISVNGAGSTNVNTVGTTTTVTTGNTRTIINWNNFDVANGYTVNFVVNNGTDLVVNRVTGGTFSSINGTVASYIGATGGTKGGTIWLLNPNGIAVGSTGRFDVGGLALSTLGLTDADILDGNSHFNFSGATSSLVTTAAGAQMTARTGGVYVFGDAIYSNGSYSSAGGNALISARNIIVDFDPNFGEMLSLNVGAGSSQANGVVLGAGSTFAGTLTQVIGNGMTTGQGNVLLVNPGGANDIRFTAGEVQLLSNSAGVTVQNSLSTPGNLTIAANTGTVSATGTLSAAGDLTVFGSTITSPASANFVAGGDVTMRGVVQTTNDLGVSAGRNIDFSSVSSTTVGGNYAVTAQDFIGPVFAPTLLGANSGFSITDTLGGFSLGFNIVAPGTVSLSATNGGVLTTSGNITSTNGDVQLHGAGGLSLGGTVTTSMGAGRSITLSGGGITQAGGQLITDTVSANSTGGITLNQANQFAQGGFDAHGAINVRSDVGGVLFTQATTSAGSVDLTAQNGMTLSDSTVRTDDGSISLNGAVVQVGTPAGTTTVTATNGGVRFNGTLDGDVANPSRMVVTSTAGTTFERNIGATTAIGGLKVNGASRFNADLANSGSYELGAVTIGGSGGMFNFYGGAFWADTVTAPGRSLGIQSVNGSIQATSISAGDFANGLDRDVVLYGAGIEFGGGSAGTYSMTTPGGLYVTGALTTRHLSGDIGNFAMLNDPGNRIDAIGAFASNGLLMQSANGTIIDGIVDSRTFEMTIRGTDPSSVIQIDSAGQVRGREVALSSGAFVNNSGADAIQASGHWVVYQANPLNGIYDGLDSGQTAIWGRTIDTLAPSAVTGNRYVFANTPTLTFTTTGTTKTYGTDLTGSAGSYYTVSGFQPGVTGAYLGDTAASVFSGAPSITSTGFGTRASVAGGPYAVNIANGTLVALNGYAFAFNNAGTVTVTPKALTGTVTADTKTYDGTTAGTGSVGLNGVVAGDTVGATATFTFDTKNAGTNKTVTVSGATLNGADAGNYTLTVPASVLGAILQKAISGTVTVTTKTYDGTTAGTGSVALNGVVTGDDVNASATYTYADKNAGTGKTVTVAGGTLTGADAGNYTLTLPASALGDILKKAITGTPTVTTKTYDGTTNAAGTIGLNGVVSGDNVGATGTFTFSDKSAGTNKTVTISATTLTGTDAGNYTLTVPASAVGDILRKAITGTTTVTTKTYDGTTSGSGTIALNGVVTGDAVGATGTFTYADKNAGTGKLVTVSGVTLNGADAGNYTISVPASALGDILRKSITGVATVANKTYDGTTAGTGSIALSGVVAGDSVGANGTYTFNDANAGNGKTVTVGGVTLTGSDAGNYTVVVPGSTVADILRRAITVTANPTSKPQGSTDPALTYGITQGSLVAGDSLTGALSRAGGEAPGTYAIGQGTLNASTNYQLTFVGSTLTITEATVDPTDGLTVNDDVGGVLDLLDERNGGGDAARSREPSTLDIVDERSPCDQRDGRTGACEAGRPH